MNWQEAFNLAIAAGLSPGSTQSFRLVARISAGAVRTVIASGTASASA